jgi:hypothetical protein
MSARNNTINILRGFISISLSRVQYHSQLNNGKEYPITKVYHLMRALAIRLARKNQQKEGRHA